MSLGITENLEHGIWKIRVSNINIYIIGMYHPLQSQNVNHQDFLNEFITLVSTLRTSYKNMIILGDLNLHLNDPNDLAAGQFMENLEALGLYQCVTFPTHKSNNTLDVIISDIIGKIKPIYIRAGEFILDHCFVKSMFNIKKDPLPIKEVEFRKFKDINMEMFANDMDLDSIDGTNLDELLQSFNEKITDALNIHAPIQKSKITNRKSRPWYNEDLKKQHRIVRNWERIWRKYKEDHQWNAYQQERLRYNKHLYKERCQYIKNEVVKHKGNAKHLYKLV